MASPQQKTVYTEVVRQPIWLAVLVVGLSLLMSFAFMAVAGPAGFAGLLLLMAGGLLTLVHRSRLVVQVTDTELVAGRVAVDLVDITGVQALDVEATRRVLGPDADVRARLIIRNLATRTAVRFDLQQPRATPYLVVSVRRPVDLAAAVDRARAAAHRAAAGPAER